MKKEETTNTLLHIFRWHVSERPNDLIFTWVDSKGDVTNTFTYNELWDTSLSVVDLLRQHNVKAGDRVMVSYPPGLDFMAGLFGCMLLRVIPCSVYPPDLRNGKARHSFDQFNNQASDAGAEWALTTVSYRRMLLAMTIKGHRTKVKWLATDKLKNDDNTKDPKNLVCSIDDVNTNDIALIQYSSGSTSSPKGVMISHSALKHNLEYIAAIAGVNEVKSSMLAMWLPQYHDYGLILAYLTTLFSERCRMVSFSPFDFIQNPLLWADIIEKFHATHMAGPNFAYELLAKRMKSKNQKFQYDQNFVRANISAEPIAPETIDAMMDIGIPKHAISPSYGIAESCACVSSALGENISIIDGVVSVGDVVESLDHDVRFAIVDPETREILQDKMEGEICISSPSLASGYWQRPDLDNVFTALVLDGRNYFATGDLGRIVGKKLYVNGRQKELIIINGRNVYPTDIERSLENEYPYIMRPGSTVAYQYSDTAVGVVLEIRDSAMTKMSSTITELLSPEGIRCLLRNAHNVEVGSLYFLKQGTVPKTTSGKLCRVDSKNRCEMQSWPKKMVLHQYTRDINNGLSKNMNHKKSKKMDSQNITQTRVESLPSQTSDRILTHNEFCDYGDKTIMDVLSQHKEEKPNHIFLRWVDSKADVVESMTYEELWKASTSIALLLKDRGVKEGDRVMVAYPPGPAFLSGIFGCFRARVIPCSAYPPNPKDKRAKYSFEHFNAQVSDAGAKFALTTASFRNIVVGSNLINYKSNVKWLAADNLKSRESEIHVLDASSKATMNGIAFIQYSSGSTSNPKGVLISHGSLMHNLYCIYCTNYNDKTKDLTYSPVSWLPQFHDYGLVASFFMSVYSSRCPLVAFSPSDFIKNPLLWYQVMEKYRATHTAGPNFGYALLAKRMKINNQCFKSSQLVRANIAAEPIAPKTLDLMKDVGIPTNAINPCYGMAECCAYVSSILGDEVNIVNGAVSVGDIRQSRALGFKFVIIDPDSQDILCDGCEGEIHVATPSLTSGYWTTQKSQKSDSDFKTIELDGEKYLATGDLGKIFEGRLFVCGRLKELIIINGKNVYPTDLERTLEAEFSSLIRPGSSVAYQHTDSTVGIVLEIRNIAISKSTELQLDSFRSLLRQAHDVEVSSIFVLKQASVPKTTSGKLRRVEVKRTSINNTWDKSHIISHYDGSKFSNNCHSLVRSNNETDKCQEFVSLVEDVLGTKFDEAATWDEIGLSSMASVQLRDSIEEVFHAILPVDCFEQFETPKALKKYVMNLAGIPLQINPKTLSLCPSRRISWIMMDAFQLIGVATLVLIFSVSIIPAWHFGAWLSNDDTTELFAVGSRWLQWFWLPFAVPTFLISFSIVVVLLKWIMIGRYREVEISVLSFAYLRWWWIDRLVHLWELWVGRFIQGTVLLPIFYRFMGANVRITTKMDSMIREFDLVQVGKCVEIKHPIRCKKFKHHTENNKNEIVLQLSSITIHDGGIVRGMVGQGVTVEKDATIEYCASVPDFATVPSGHLAKGVPAFDSGPNVTTKAYTENWSLEGLKICWLVVELYNFFALLLVAQLIYIDRLPSDWRYTRLCNWFLYITTINIFLVLESVVIKWCFVGKRRAGPSSTSMLRDFFLWAADYHYMASIPILLSLSSNSNIMWNAYLRMMGMDIDFLSKVSAASFVPSMMDLVRIKNSVISTVSFAVGKEGMLFETFIEDSSLGYNVHVAPGVKLERILIPPITLVEENASQEHVDKRCFLFTTTERMKTEFLLLFSYIFMLGVILVSLVPAYELWTAVFDPSTAEMAVPVLALSLVVQTAVWVVLLRLLQYAAYGKSLKVRSGPVTPACFLYLSYGWVIQTWSFLSILSGTLYFNAVARFMGARVNGRLICLARRVYDWSYLSFDATNVTTNNTNKANSSISTNNTITASLVTVVDDAFLNGHFGVYQEMTIGPCCIAGIVHEGTWISVGADIDKNAETGPMRAVLKAPTNTTSPSSSSSPTSYVDEV